MKSSLFFLSTPLALPALLPAAVSRRCQSSGNSCPGLPAFHLQKKGGKKKAKGVTIQEWQDFMQALQAKINEELAKPEKRAAWRAATGGFPEHCPPIFSFDNPKIHTDPEALAALGIVDGQNRLVLPPYSPDLHRAIERVHARICRTFQMWVNKDTKEYCMAGYCAYLERIFYSTEKPSITASDVDNIDKLYHKIIELKGNRAPRPFC